MDFLPQLSKYATNTAFVLYHYLILPLRYRLNILGIKRIKTRLTDPKGGILFLASHPSHLDPSLVGFALWKNHIRLYIWTVDYVFKHIFTRFAARSSDSVKLLKVPDVFEGRSAKHADKSRRLIHKTVEKLRKGNNVLFFPGGRQKLEPYEEISGKSAVQRILKLYPDVNIVLVTITGMWGSRFSKAVKKSERSNLKANSILRFLWNILKIVLLNGLFFIPKRNIRIEFTPIGSEFPRQGTRQEINRYLEEFINRGFGREGEPLQKVSNYFWKTKYPAYEYHLKSYRYDADQIPVKLRDDVMTLVAQKAGLKTEDVKDEMHLARDLSIDSLETTEILCELEKRYHLPRYAPKHVTTVGHLVALVARIPVDYVPIKGQFPQVIEEPASMVRLVHACAAFVVGLFGFFAHR